MLLLKNQSILTRTLIAYISYPNLYFFNISMIKLSIVGLSLSNSLFLRFLTSKTYRSLGVSQLKQSLKTPFTNDFKLMTLSPSRNTKLAVDVRNYEKCHLPTIFGYLQSWIISLINHRATQPTSFRLSLTN